METKSKNWLAFGAIQKGGNLLLFGASLIKS
jgi:hypothetical protein